MEEVLEGQLDLWQSMELMKKEEKVESVEIKGSDINYNDITIGNIVETILNGEKVIGKVVNEYGPGKCALSIIYDNDKKHTAINRYSVTKVLGKVN